MLNCSLEAGWEISESRKVGASSIAKCWLACSIMSLLMIDSSLPQEVVSAVGVHLIQFLYYKTSIFLNVSSSI